LRGGERRAVLHRDRASVHDLYETVDETLEVM